jgi:non-specific serine/threonine protein kinase
MDWSHDLMTADERRLFRRLSVFSGGFTLTSAEAVCCGDDLKADEVLAVLSRLVDKSVVSMQDDRYHLLQTVREYAGEQLRESNEMERFRDRHREHFQSLAEPLDTPNKIRDLKPELDNCAAALDASIPDHPESGLRIASGLLAVWWQGGRVQEARHWLERLLLLHTPPDAVRSRALSTASWFASQQADMETARSTATEGLAIARTLNDERLLEEALYHATTVALTDEDYSLATRHIEEGLPIARAQRNVFRTAAFVNCRAIVA